MNRESLQSVSGAKTCGAHVLSACLRERREKQQHLEWDICVNMVTSKNGISWPKIDYQKSRSLLAPSFPF